MKVLEKCNCIQCVHVGRHSSDCGVHNSPVEICDCFRESTYVESKLRTSIGSILYDDFAPGHDYDEGEKQIARLSLLIVQMNEGESADERN